MLGSDKCNMWWLQKYTSYSPSHGMLHINTFTLSYSPLVSRDWWTDKYFTAYVTYSYKKFISFCGILNITFTYNFSYARPRQWTIRIIKKMIWGWYRNSHVLKAPHWLLCFGQVSACMYSAVFMLPTDNPNGHFE